MTALDNTPIEPDPPPSAAGPPTAAPAAGDGGIDPTSPTRFRNDRALGRAFVQIAIREGRVTLEVPDVDPSVEPVLRAFAWPGHPQLSGAAELPDSGRWATLREVGLDYLGFAWRTLPTDALWAAHATALADWRAGLGRPGSPNLLDIKAELARRESSPCRLCAVRCLARRLEGESGACGATNIPRAFTRQILTAEEPLLGRGAALRLSGCNARCTYCGRPDGISARSGRPIAVGEARAWLTDQAGQVDALHWIGGNVDQEIPFILEVLRDLPGDRPLIWNHNSTASVEVALPLLDGVVDVYLPDLRYGPGDCAARTGAAALDFATCTAAIAAEIAQGALVLVRVLVLPGHTECCARPVLEFLSAYRDRAYLSLLDFSYAPAFRAVGDPALGRPVSSDERRTVERWVTEFRLRRVS